jgi:hypothetical protein
VRPLGMRRGWPVVAESQVGSGLELGLGAPVAGGQREGLRLACRGGWAPGGAVV